MRVAEAVIIAFVEGITEFLPISSTGHMIIAEKLLGVPHDDFTKLFTVGIQLGTILAVVVLYWKKFNTPLPAGRKGGEFYMKLLVACYSCPCAGIYFFRQNRYFAGKLPHGCHYYDPGWPYSFNY